MNLGDIAKHLSGDLLGNASLAIDSINDIHSAVQGQLTFVLEKHYIMSAQTSSASAFITYKQIDSLDNQIIIKSPKKALALCISLFKDSVIDSYIKDHRPHIADSATISDSAVIGHGCMIGNNSNISANVCIGNHCCVGDNTIIHPNVSLYDHTIIGNNVTVHAGVVLGSDGFGYYKESDQWLKIPHIGYVQIDDHVEIGSNTCIDRGCIGVTHIMEGCKLDNLVHISHNCIIGKHTAIAAQVGFTGSSLVGEHVMIGGQAGIDTRKIGSHVIITGKAGVTKTIDDHEMVSGFPAWSHKKELKKEAYLRKLLRSYQ